MAERYPRVFTPNLAFSTVAGTLTSTPAGGTGETVEGEAPSAKENLANPDPLIRWYTKGTDAAHSYVFTFTHTSNSDQAVNAVALLGFFLLGQTVNVAVRSSTAATLETVAIPVIDLAGAPSLSVLPMQQPRQARSIRYALSQNKSERSVVGFVLPGLLESLEQDIRESIDRRQLRPRVVDPFSAPVRQGEYSQLDFVVLDVSEADREKMERWASGGTVIAELSRDDWRMGQFDIVATRKEGLRWDVELSFTEQRL